MRRLALVFALVIAGCSSAPKLTDAQTIWCSTNLPNVATAGHKLGVTLPAHVLITQGGTATNIDTYTAMKANPETIWTSIDPWGDGSAGGKTNLTTIASAWQTQQPADYARACKTAYELK
jgi:hypothetical protein